MVKDLNILLVDDEVNMLEVLRDVLVTEGHTVTSAISGFEALEKLENDASFDLVISDLKMPKMSGIEVLKEIKSDPKNRNIPVVVLTNLSGDKDAERALELGAVKFIVKSKNKPKQIAAQIKEILAASTRDEIPRAAGK